MVGSKIDPKTTVTPSTLAAVIGVTSRQVANLLERGAVVRDADGGYPLFESVKKYVAFIKADNKNRARTASHGRLQDTKNRALELKIARDSNELIELSEAIEVIREVDSEFRADLDGLPAACTRDLALREKITTYLNGCYQRHVDRCAAEAAALERTGAGIQEHSP